MADQQRPGNDPYAYLHDHDGEPDSYLPPEPVVAPLDAGADPTADLTDPATGAIMIGVTRRQLREATSRRDLRAPKRRRRRGPVIAGVAGAAAVIAVGSLVVANLGNDDDGAAGPTSVPTASLDGPTTDVTSPLLTLLPTEVTGGVFAAQPEETPTGDIAPSEGASEESVEPSGGASDSPTSVEPTAEPSDDVIVYRLTADGYVPNPLPPAGALESVVGVFQGGTADVTLTASRFGTAEEALADATAVATRDDLVETGVVFPDEDRGTYWIFNTDGLVTIIWTDGDLGSYVVVSEDAGSALDFYQGLEF